MPPRRPSISVLSIRFFTPISASDTLRAFVGSIGGQSMFFLPCGNTAGADMIEFVTVENVNQFPGNASGRPASASLPEHYRKAEMGCSELQ